VEPLPKVNSSRRQYLLLGIALRRSGLLLHCHLVEPKTNQALNSRVATTSSILVKVAL
jgi:hypothetical protein